MEARTPVPMSECPNRETLRQFRIGALPEAALEQIARHVIFCSGCCAVLGDLRADSEEEALLAAIKGSLRLPKAPEVCERLVAAGQKLDADEASTIGTSVSGWVAGESTFVPREVGPYLLLARIGQGGMGAVYRARQRSLNREVAVKMILAGPHASPQAVARFRTEAEAIARQRHPNVVEIYDFGEHDGQPYFSMELVEGGSLADRLDTGPLPPRQAAELVRVLAGAVESAHQKDVLHRDLKPANVLLTPDGVPKVSDFGLAKLLDSELTPTVSGVPIGTPSYMAPEQTDGRTSAISPATDVYGLGGILYAALTGQPPFTGESPAKTYEYVRKIPPVRPARLRPGIPWQLEEICLKCLEKAPPRRYDSAQALAADLRRWLDGERPRHTPRWPERAARALRRRAVAVGTGMALILVLIVAATMLYSGDPDRPLRQMQKDLAAGRPVTLVRETGKPAWSRWRTGETDAHLVEAKNGAFTVHAWGYALLELLPDPMCESYRLTAKVRHETGRRPGEVGLYVARIAYPIEGGEVEFLIQLTFNDVNPLEAPPITINGRKVTAPAPTNRVLLIPHLYSQEGTPPNVDCSMEGRIGPPFLPGRELTTEWRELAITVTPDEISAEWEGLALHLSQEEIAAAVSDAMDKLRPKYPDFPLLQHTQPQFTVRGGLGLYLHRGSASFRAVTVTPLAGDS